MDTTAITIPGLTIAAIALSAVICIFLPVLLLLLWKRKTKASVMPFFIGIGVFVLFALVLEAILHVLVLQLPTPLSAYIWSHPLAYALYGCLAAGIFEETGRFLAMKLFKPQFDRKEAAIMYGIGHGGIESVLLAGISLLSALVMSLSVNAMGADAYLSQLPEASASVYSASIQSLVSAPFYVYFVSSYERIFAILFHISMSVLVYGAVRGNRPNIRLYPLAIILHALLNFPAALYQRGVIKNVYLVEAYVTIFVLVTVYFVRRFYLRILSAKDSGKAS